MTDLIVIDHCLTVVLKPVILGIEVVLSIPQPRNETTNFPSNCFWTRQQDFLAKFQCQFQYHYDK